jgi:hypothetical protein
MQTKRASTELAMVRHNGRVVTGTTTATRQNATDSDAIRASGLGEGLTLQQHQAAALLLAGKGVQGVADELGVHRSTVWAWRQLPTFQAFYNILLGELRQNAQEGVVSLYSDALNTLREVMTGNGCYSPAAALKAAMFVVERIETMKVGTTNARDIIREQCMTSILTDDFIDFFGAEEFDEKKYHRDCRELGIEP